MLILKYYYFFIDILKLNLGILKRPFKLNFVITKSCNSKCLNCNIWKVKPEKELSLNEIESISEKVSFFKWIDFTGGEPTNRADFPDIVRVFNKNCPNLLFVHFPTNGLLPEKIESMTKEIRSIGNFRVVVTVSIDGPEKTNDILRGISGDFRKSIETFKKLKKIAGVEVYIGMTLFQSNYKKIDETLSEIKKIIPTFCANDLHLNLGHISDHYYENQQSSDINPSIKMFNEVESFTRKRKFSFSAYGIVDFYYRKHLKKYIDSKKTPLKCLSLISSIYLSEKGVIYPCSMWNHPIENLRDHDFDYSKLVMSSRHKNALELIAQEKCSHCWTPCEAYQSILGKMPKMIL